MTTARPNKSIVNGMACLQALAMAERPVGCRELARQLTMDPTIASRILGTLTLLGLAEQTPDRKYQPGAGLHVLATQSLHGSRLLPAALPPMESFLDSGYSVSVGVLWRDAICFLLHARPGQNLITGIGNHHLRPAVESSAGIALLARRPPETWPRAAHADIESARARGHAELRFPSGETSLGLAIDDCAGVAISRRFANMEEQGQAIERLQHFARLIRADLLHPPSAVT